MSTPPTVDERLDRVEERLDRMVDALDKQGGYLLALDARMGAGFAAVVDRLDRFTDAILRGFTSRDERVAELTRRVEALEARVFEP